MSTPLSTQSSPEEIELAQDFITEALELLDRTDSSIQSLTEGDWGDQNLLELFRTAHSLKGVSGMLNLVKVVDFVHHLENLVNLFRNHKTEIIQGDEGLISASFTVLRQLITHDVGLIIHGPENFQTEVHEKTKVALDQIKSRMNENLILIETPAPPVETASSNDASSKASSPAVSPASTTAHTTSASSAPTNSAPKTIRVDIDILDRLLNIVGELVVSKNKLRHLKNCSNLSFEELAKEIGDSSRDLDYFSTEIQRAVMRMRLIPIRSVFNKIPRMTSEISSKLNKLVDVEIKGSEIEIDKSLVDSLFEPLIHIIRNAVDHGLETQEQRKTSGKPARGKIIIRAKQDLDQVIVEVEDDGRGINPDKIAAKAVEKNIITLEEAINLKDKEKIELIFHPGFSTAEVVSEVSGRGVGMDVVRTTMIGMGGNVSIKSVYGQGTLISLETPAKTGIKEALLVEYAKSIYAVPVEQVTEAIKFDQLSALPLINSGQALKYRGEIIGLETLGYTLGHRNEIFQSDKNNDQKVLIVQKEGFKMGLLVDAVLSKQQILIKDLPRQLKHNPMIKAATYLWDGREILVLDPAAYVLSLIQKMNSQSS